MNRIILLLLVLGFFGCGDISSQNQLDEAYVTELVKKISKTYAENYTFPEKGNKASELLLEKLEQGVYFNQENYDSLAVALKKDLFSITQDKHVAVIYKAKKADSLKEEQPKRPSVDEFFKSMENYGFTEIEIKEGNIGYVKMPVFFPIRMDAKAKDAADKMMAKFKNCGSIIFDLTECRGGDPAMLTYVISYLFPKDKKVHLNDFYYRPNESTMSSFTEPVKGKTLHDVDVYVLTSGKTFSAGEEFSYDLKSLKRATLIGETTGGGAHTVEPRILDEQFELMIPTGRAINPITKTNWETVGVQPDIEIESDKALEKAMEVISTK